MKRIIPCILSLALSVVLTTSYAQSQEQTTPVPRSVEVTGTTTLPPKLVSDPMVSERLARDLSSRNSATETQNIQWYETSYGYTGNYTIGSARYIARYDQQGNYMETLRRTPWNNANVPATLINAYSQSPYKDQTVTGYWAVTDPGKTGYYLELCDARGTSSTVWVDGQGKFTTAPYNSTTATSGSIPKD